MAGLTALHLPGKLLSRQLLASPGPRGAVLLSRIKTVKRLYAYGGALRGIADVGFVYQRRREEAFLLRLGAQSENTGELLSIVYEMTEGSTVLWAGIGLGLD